MLPARNTRRFRDKIRQKHLVNINEAAHARRIDNPPPMCRGDIIPAPHLPGVHAGHTDLVGKSLSGLPPVDDFSKIFHVCL